MGKTIQNANNADQFIIWCPGCKTKHYIPIRNKEKHGHTWSFNENTERPSFSPSVKYSFPAYDGTPETSICHFFVTEGNIIFQADCQHELAGQNVPLLDYSEWPVRL